MIKLVLGLLVVFTLIFLYFLTVDILKVAKNRKISSKKFSTLSLVGLIVMFFDTLGIGSFAPTTSIFKIFGLVDEEKIPGTLNVSMTVPIVLEALIFIRIIEVDILTLISMIAAATLGAILGAGIVTKLDGKKVILGMSMALLAVAVVMLSGQLKWLPVGGDATALSGTKLFIGLIGNFILGALMTIGIGLYAPCMALVYALGMSPKVAFPIMMGSCAFLMPFASIKFIKEGAYDKKASIAITLLGSVGVLIAAYIVKELPLYWLKWIIIAVVLYTSTMMFKTYVNYNKKIQLEEAV